MRLWLAVGIALAFGLTACGGHTLKGSVTIIGEPGDAFTSHVGGCSGSGGYSDVTNGGQVVVQDGSGNVIATGTLGPGDEGAGTCRLPLTVENVPDENFYKVGVGHRGPVTYSKDDLDRAGWTADLTLGS